MWNVGLATSVLWLSFSLSCTGLDSGDRVVRNVAFRLKARARITTGKRLCRLRGIWLGDDRKLFYSLTLLIIRLENLLHILAFSPYRTQKGCWEIWRLFNSQSWWWLSAWIANLAMSWTLLKRLSSLTCYHTDYTLVTKINSCSQK